MELDHELASTLGNLHAFRYCSRARCRIHSRGASDGAPFGDDRKTPKDGAAKKGVEADGLSHAKPGHEYTLNLGGGEKLDDEEVQAFVIKTIRTPYEPNLADGSWQRGSHRATIRLSLMMVAQQEIVHTTLLKIVDGSVETTVDQRGIAMSYVAHAAPERTVPLLIKSIETPRFLPIRSRPSSTTKSRLWAICGKPRTWRYRL